MNTQLTLRIGALLGAAIIILGLALTIQHDYATRDNGSLALTVVPADAKLLIDNQTHANPGTLSLSPGSHSITLSRDGFTSQTITVTITSHEHDSQTVALAAANSTGVNYLSNNSDQAAAADGIASAQVQKNGQIITANNPLIELLPYKGADYQIDFGVSQKYPNNPDAAAIYITTDTAAGQAHALAWIKAQGYNPAAYEIIYQNTSTIDSPGGG